MPILQADVPSVGFMSVVVAPLIAALVWAVRNVMVEQRRSTDAQTAAIGENTKQLALVLSRMTDLLDALRRKEGCGVTLPPTSAEDLRKRGFNV